MPYITKEAREELKKAIRSPANKGELNYVLTLFMLHYVQHQGASYQTISDAISAATDAGEEMRRRLLNPYEDKKIRQNGDIYES
jgi:DNA-binding protein